jgi:Glycoside hydrolase family 44
MTIDRMLATSNGMALGAMAVALLACGQPEEASAPLVDPMPAVLREDNFGSPGPSRGEPGHHDLDRRHDRGRKGARDAGGPDATAGDAGTDGAADAEAGTSVAACTGAPPLDPVITDFSDAVAGPSGITFGTYPRLSGGTFTYAALGQGTPALSLVAAGADQALQVTDSTGVPTDPGNAWSGFGLYFNSCVDASAFAGIEFTITGDLGACSLSLVVGFSEDGSVAYGPLGSCTASTCLFPGSPPLATGTSTVLFSDLAGGAPVPAVNPATLTGVQWQFAAPAGGCSASFTVDDVKFIGSGGSVGDGGAPGPDGGPVTFAVDLTRGPARQFDPPAEPQRVSDYVYGVNAALIGTAASVDLVARPTQWGLIRQGGNAFTSWNWTNNYDNAGSDYCFDQFQGVGGGAPAGAVTVSGDTIAAAQAKGEAYLATVPVVDYVSGAYDNPVATCPVSGAFCDGTTISTRVNPNGLPFATDADAGAAGGPAFVANLAAKPGGVYCTCRSAGECDGGCAIAAGPIYQDEFVHFIRDNYGTGGSPILFNLDNEPNYWGSTHPDLWPVSGELPCQTYSVTYDDIVSRDITFATAIKSAWPGAKVLGPVVAQDGLVYAHSYSADPHAPTEFLDYYLQSLAAASASSGQSLLDVLDVHYYTNNGNPSDAQCVQSPRLFWDPGYTTLSAAQTYPLDFGWPGIGNYFLSPSWYPRKLIPRLLGKIANAYAAGAVAAPGLSISEYNSGCEADIAGGLAQADLLGVFGREGVYAAAAWPVQSLTGNYLLAAFDLYRNYDGQGAIVGDTTVLATTSDGVDTSIYAFAHSDDPLAVDLVAINKSNVSIVANITLAGAAALAQASAYLLVAGSVALVPASGAPVVCTANVCTLSYTMPPMSATTLVVR